MQLDNDIENILFLEKPISYDIDNLRKDKYLGAYIFENSPAYEVYFNMILES